VPAANGFGQSLLVHELAAGAVDDPHAFLGVAEEVPSHDALRLRSERQVQADVVGAREQFGERNQGDIQIARDKRGNEGIVGEDFEFQSPGALDHLDADAPQAQDSQNLPAQLLPLEKLLLPAPGVRGLVGLRDGPRHGEHQRQGVLGDADGIAAGRVHHQHAFLGGGFDVHVVHADAGAPDHLQARGAFEQLRVRLHGAPHDQRRGVAQFREQLLAPGLRLDHLPSRLGSQQLDPLAGNLFGNDDFHPPTPFGLCPAPGHSNRRNRAGNAGEKQTILGQTLSQCQNSENVEVIPKAPPAQQDCIFQLKLS